MASLAELTANYAIPGVLDFDEPHPGMVRARVHTASCTGEFYLHGAHITQWAPAGAAPVLYLSPRSLYTQDKAIRGGIPVIFPWFGPRTVEVTGHRTGGQHGFARTSEWTLAFAAAIGEDVRVVLTLEPSDASRAAGFDHFRTALEITFGSTLRVRMTVANEGAEPLVFEEALHTYFHVADVHDAALTGLIDTVFLDKTDNYARKTQTEDPLQLTAETDRTYMNTRATITIADPELARNIFVEKGGSETTVVWNPWAELAKGLSDLGAENWPHFVCVEAANAGENRITLAPQEAHVMELHIRVEPQA